MCGQCKDFKEQLRFGSLREYHAWVRRVDEAIQHDIFIVVRKQEDWPEMVWQANGNPIRTYLGDVIEFGFECSLCRSAFAMWADLYHGGAGWEIERNRSIQSQ